MICLVSVLVSMAVILLLVAVFMVGVSFGRYNAVATAIERAEGKQQ